ncbi:zinc finger CCCH domain-containing protein 3-like isoform X2 [Dendronephthya gigantea]|uniref:zinc finger CCCH domain-containing protein 3-like isoform X2 n=1 Tax=Dendronephthya gigantea TaxID=151771 RepID=UPI00106AD6DB|nr:zinc finger CCCH domain-containing protein 3-like isoform X2 [Dendronephthya gigantea]
MADDGAENLRKQIAFLSNLIDSHKNGNGKQNKTPVIPNPKENKTWSRWKTGSRQFNHKEQNTGSAQIVLDNRKLSSNNKTVQSSHRLRNSYVITRQNSKHNVTASKNDSKILHIPNSKTTSLSYIPPITNQPKSHVATKYRLHRNPVLSKSAPPLIPLTSSMKKPDKNVLSETSGPSSATNTPLKMIGRTSNGYSKQQSSATLTKQRIGNFKWAKIESHSPLNVSRSKTENKREQSVTKHVSSAHPRTTLTPVERTIVLPKPLRKTTCLTATPEERVVVLPKSDRAAPTLTGRATKSTNTSIRSLANVPKTYTTSSKALTGMNEDTVPTSAFANRRVVNLRKRQKSSSKLTSSTDASNVRTVSGNTRKVAVKGSTSLDRRPLPTTNPRLGTYTLQSSAVSKGAKLKWRRKSASQLTNDPAGKNTRSKNLHGNELQTRLALKSKWRKAEPVSLTRKKVISIANNRHSRADLLHTRHAKNMPSLRTVPHLRRSNLKWSKSSSQTSLLQRSEQSSSKSDKPKFVHNSRFSLRRRRSSDGRKVLAGDYLGSRRVHYRTGAIGKVKSQNKGFLARRLRYIAYDSKSQHISRLESKYSLRKYAKTPLKRKVKIGGSIYLIGSHGKTLKKTVPLKYDKTSSYPTSLRRNSLHIYRRPSTAPSSFTNAVQKIFKRQNSVDKNKTRKANKILKRTVQAIAKRVKKQKSKSEEYCMFFNKFGKCTKKEQGKCPYVHDPTKIAVCTRFLRGKCQQLNGTCPFSHKIDKEKMPICQYFLKGKCNRDDCPYSHVNVGRQADVCEDFLKGYCALGFKCKKKHVLECEEFSTTGQCANRSRCKLIHRRKLQRPGKRYFDEASSRDAEDGVRDVKRTRRKSSDGFLPLDGCALSEDDYEKETIQNFSLRIRPNFASKEFKP